MTRADFEERAAILEYDGGLPRAAAEAQTIREICDHAADPPGILGELARADRCRWHPDLAPVLADLGLANVRGPAWGFGPCMFEGSTYRPANPGEHGRLCLIVPAGEYGKLHDLAAMDLADRHTATRQGVAGVVGFDEIDRARVNSRPLFVFNDLLAWLRGGALGVAVVDWARAVEIFDDVPLLLCAASMVDRLEQATANCWQPPSIAAIGCRYAA